MVNGRDDWRLTTTRVFSSSSPIDCSMKSMRWKFFIKEVDQKDFLVRLFRQTNVREVPLPSPDISQKRWANRWTILNRNSSLQTKVHWSPCSDGNKPLRQRVNHLNSIDNQSDVFAMIYKLNFFLVNEHSVFVSDQREEICALFSFHSIGGRVIPF